MPVREPRLPKEVRTVDDVREFFTHLYAVDDVSFHPDDRFFRDGEVQYVDREGRPTYTPAAAKLRDRLMSQSWRVMGEAGVDIYCFGMWIAHQLGFQERPDPEFCPPFPISVLPPMGPKAWSPRKRT